MKVCFFLQRRFATIGHAMACHMQKLSPDMEFCGVVQLRSNMEFLRNQKDIPYTSLILEEDLHRKIKNEKLDLEYLRRIEQGYGIPNLWPYLYVDRVVMNGQLRREYPYDKAYLSYEDMLKLVQVTARELETFFDKERPGAVVFSVIGSVGSLLLYTMAKKRGVKTIILEIARMRNRIILTEDYLTFSGVRNKLEQFRSGADVHIAPEARAYLEEFREKPAPYDVLSSEIYTIQSHRSSNLRFLTPLRLYKSILWHLKAFAHDLPRASDPDYSDVFIWWKVWDKLKRKVRSLIGYDDLYTKPDWNERFAFYPLHGDPEIATLLLAPLYTDQKAVIKAIARSLPVCMPLYVKEHPEVVGYRPRAYYKELLKIPNVRLIPPTIRGTELAKHAALTITLTSTSGFESSMFKRPVITFGDIFYNELSGVMRCRSFEDLANTVKHQLENFSHNEEELLALLSAVIEESVEVDFLDLWNSAASLERIRGDAGMQKLSAHLFERIR